jgi:zinc transport system substrate-binding protein
MTEARKHSTMSRLCVIVAGIAIAGLRCSEGPAPPSTPRQDGAIAVSVTIPPLASVVERIGGERVRVDVLVEQGRDPHSFEPAPRQMAALAKAALLFTAGAPFEETLAAKAAGGAHGLTVVDTSAGIAKEDTAEHAAVGDDGHAHDHAHHKDGMDPHVWLAPEALRVMARNVCEALASADAAHASEYRANLAAFLAETDALDQRIGQALAPFEGRAFYVFHPAFGHFAEAYGLRQKAIEVGGKAPSAKALQELIKEARADHVRAVFVQPQHGTGSAETIAQAIGADLVTLDPLARDVLDNLDQIAAHIERALKP